LPTLQSASSSVAGIALAPKVVSSAERTRSTHVESLASPMDDGGGAIGNNGGSKSFAWKLDLAGHTGAVYTARFSRCGQYLVSGSFDRSVRVWAVEKLAEGARLCFSDAHAASVVAVAWSGSGAIVSGGYDHAVHEWDVEAQRLQPVATYRAEGFVQTVALDSTNSSPLVYVGTSRNCIQCFDRRERAVVDASSGSSSSSGAAQWVSKGTTQVQSSGVDSTIVPETAAGAGTIRNDAMINSLHITTTGVHLISGDHAGAIKTWDTRMIRARSSSSASQNPQNSPHHEPVSAMLNDTDRRPITHVHLSSTRRPIDGLAEDGRFLAVNSYDNFLRVYDRTSSGLLFGDAPNRSPPPARARNALRGVENRSWPIQSSFFEGSQFDESLEKSTGASESSRIQDSLSVRGVDGASLRTAAHVNLVDDDDVDDIHASIRTNDSGVRGDRAVNHAVLSSGSSATETLGSSAGTGRIGHGSAGVGLSLDRSLLLASGSADGNAYVFDVSTASNSGLLQVLSGHSERVYCANFHPIEPILATCSADHLIKIWAPSKRGSS